MIKNDNSGLTLIETMIALSLIIILAAAFAGAMVTGLKSEKTTNSLDQTVNFSASIFDLFNQDFEIILSKIVLNSNKYTNTLEDFKNEINNSAFNKIYDFHTKKLNYNSDKSKIIIEKINENLKLYKVQLIISWKNGNENGSYELKSIFGGSYE